MHTLKKVKIEETKVKIHKWPPNNNLSLSLSEWEKELSGGEENETRKTIQFHPQVSAEI